MKIILLSGKAQHGKDTVAKIMGEYFKQKEIRFMVVHYADYLKFVCEKYFNWDGKKDDYGRSLLQYVGTDLARSQKESFWVDTVIRLVEIFFKEYDYIIIPDWRFVDEAVRWVDEGYDVVTVRVNRFDSFHGGLFDNGLRMDQKCHRSETALDNFKFDHIIINPNGQINDLRDNVKEVLKSIEEG